MTPDAHLHTVRRHYPDALTTVDSVNRLFDIVHRRFGLEPRELLSADSVCSDEINSIEYPRRAYEMTGPFKMGGLDGFPFTGLTGMAAFAAHVPESGAVFIYHAPHIGISRDGTLGVVHRFGQAKPSGCCGACRAALAKLEAGQIVNGELSELDYQQNAIEQILYRQRERVLSATSPLREATEVMYDAIAERIDALTSRTTFNARYLILMGAVLINGDHDMGSYSSNRRLIAIDLMSAERLDLLEDLLAGWSPT